MLEFLKMSTTEKNDTYRIVSEEKKINEAIIEKDYWVVLMLYLLFTESKFKKFFAFKGGTSLSKSYHKIQRFSEDIDLILDWRVLGYKKEEPWEHRSKTGQRKFNDEANEKAAQWISNQLIPELNRLFETLNIKNMRLTISERDPQTIQVFYPNDFNDTSILQEIRLEIGPLAAWTPITNKEVSAYLVEEFPHLFHKKTVTVPTVEAKRTFWEKVTILHKEAHRISTTTPARYSRHYYDIYQLALSEVKIQALDDLNLLTHVVNFKTKFYADNSAKDEDAVPGKIKLLPNEYQIDNLEKDYQLMENMIFGDYPSFNLILAKLKELEIEINGCLN